MIYTNQRRTASDIREHFKAGQRWVHLEAEMQVGKTGVVAALAELYEDVCQMYFYTALPYTDIKKQNQERLPSLIMVNANSKDTNLLTLEFKREETILVIDENHWGSQKRSNMHKLLLSAGVDLSKAPSEWQAKNVKILTVSATPFQMRAVNTAAKDNAVFVYHSPGTSYYGLRDMLNRDVIRQTFGIWDGEVLKGEFIRLLQSLPTENSIALVRDRKLAREIPKLEAAMGANYLIFTVGEHGTAKSLDEELRKLQKQPSTIPVIIVVAHLARVSQTIPKKWITLCFDNYTKNPNADTVLQSLAGRMCGYYNSPGERAGQCVIYTDVKACEDYVNKTNPKKFTRGGVQDFGDPDSVEVIDVLDAEVMQRLVNRLEPGKSAKEYFADKARQYREAVQKKTTRGGNNQLSERIYKDIRDLIKNEITKRNPEVKVTTKTARSLAITTANLLPESKPAVFRTLGINEDRAGRKTHVKLCDNIDSNIHIFKQSPFGLANVEESQTIFILDDWPESLRDKRQGKWEGVQVYFLRRIRVKTKNLQTVVNNSSLYASHDSTELH